MSNSFSKKINNNELNIILKYMSSHLKENNNKNIMYFFKTSKYTITIYNNFTLFIQGDCFENILKMLDINKGVEKIKKVYNVGSDESGNGDFFGGLAVAACYINNDEDFEFLKKIGVKDSKKIDDQKIIQIAPLILNKIVNSIVYVSPSEYNELFNEFGNINMIKTYMHANAINTIKKSDKNIIIDQYTSKEKFKDHLKKINMHIDGEYNLETKAESKYLVVAAASILARYKFISELKNIEDKIGINLPLGSVDKYITPTLCNIKKDKKIVLKDICKTHFKTINK